MTKGACPSCLLMLTTSGVPHCKGMVCGWVKCKCGATIDMDARRFYKVG